jgi:dTDP-4-dehydrorhamnose reductase
MAAEAVGAKICYISTDYVFDGESATPYSEKQLTNPKSVYGKSKLAGENYVKSLSSKYFIVRTSWVFGFHGNNFVKTMLRLSEENTSLKVVNDQIGSPTYTLDLSIFIRHLVMTEDYGVYHATNTGECSWFEFANEIFKQSNISIDLVPCSTEHLSRPAPRPKYSVLKHEEILEKNMPELRSWREALSDFLKLLN